MPGQRLLKDESQFEYPAYTHVLECFLKTAEEFSSRLWSKLCIETRKFYVERNQDFKNTHDYTAVCRFIAQKYQPHRQIDQVVFKEKLVKCFKARRAYLKGQAERNRASDFLRNSPAGTRTECNAAVFSSSSESSSESEQEESEEFSQSSSNFENRELEDAVETATSPSGQGRDLDGYKASGSSSEWEDVTGSLLEQSSIVEPQKSLNESSILEIPSVPHSKASHGVDQQSTEKHFAQSGSGEPGEGEHIDRYESLVSSSEWEDVTDSDFGGSFAKELQNLVIEVSDHRTSEDQEENCGTRIGRRRISDEMSSCIRHPSIVGLMSTPSNSISTTTTGCEWDISNIPNCGGLLASISRVIDFEHRTFSNSAIQYRSDFGDNLHMPHLEVVSQGAILVGNDVYRSYGESSQLQAGNSCGTGPNGDVPGLILNCSSSHLPEEPTKNLIEFDTTIFDSGSSFNNFAYLNRVFKREHRPAPSSMRTDFSLVCALNELYSLRATKDPNVILRFRELFCHRTILITNMTVSHLLKEYPCLQDRVLMEIECELLYTSRECKLMNENTAALVRGMLKLHSTDDTASAVEAFFRSLNPATALIKKFYDKAEYAAFGLDDFSEPFVCIYAKEKRCLDVRVAAWGLDVQTDSLESALFILIMIFHILEKPFPSKSGDELRVLESFVLGNRPRCVRESVGMYCERLAETFSEIETL